LRRRTQAIQLVVSQAAELAVLPKYPEHDSAPIVGNSSTDTDSACMPSSACVDSRTEGVRAFTKSRIIVLYQVLRDRRVLARG